MKSSQLCRVMCLGEAMMELSFEGDIASGAGVSFAGDTLNTAVYLKRCIADRGEVAFVSAVGTDIYSQCMLDRIAHENVVTDHVRLLEGKLPGIYGISIDEQGERSFHYWRENSAARALFQDPALIAWDAMSRADLIYYSGITLALMSQETRHVFFRWLEDVRQDGNTLVAFDTNYRPALWPSPGAAAEAIEAAWKISDIALPSLEDEMMVFGTSGPEDVLKRLRGYGLERGALKCGLRGAIPIDPNASAPVLEFVENVVDTTAAGDSFNGAYLASLLTGSSDVEAIAAGHACASQVIRKRGAIVAFDGTG